MALKPRTARIIRISALVALGVVLLVCAYWLRAIFNPLLVAALIAYVLSPVVDWMERKGMSRTGAIAILYGLFALMIVGPASLGFTMTYNQVSQLGWAVTGEPFVDSSKNGRYDPGEPFTDENGNNRYDFGYLDRLIDWSRDHLDRWNVKHEQEAEMQINFSNLLQRLKSGLRGNLARIGTTGLDVSKQLARGATKGIGRAIGFATALLLIPIYAFFLLRGINDIRDAVYAHIPGRYRERTVDVLGKIHRAASSFFRGRLIICICVGALTALGLMICRVRFSILIGLLVGFGSIIPFVGVIAGLVPACLFGYLDHGWASLIGVIVVFSVVQTLEGFVLTPWILGKEVELHPITLIVCVFVGGEVLGLFGVLLAVPLTCVLKILGQEFVLPQVRILAEERAGRTRKSSRKERAPRPPEGS